MPLICYKSKRFDDATVSVIDSAVEIVEDYARQGYDLTLRQIYYKFVSRDLFPDRWWLWDSIGRKWVRSSEGVVGATKNAEPNYKWLGGIVNDARLAGLIDWQYITDRTRNLEQNGHWECPQDIVRACSQQFRIDRWVRQGNYVEAWIEKDALVGILEKACVPLDIPYFSCRGYTSQSEMWAASQRLLGKMTNGKDVHIIHLGDHDPSGVDMSRDIEQRLKMFVQHHLWENEDVTATLSVHRIALNMDQVRQHRLPPNPAKTTDARSSGYMDRFGDESWELDALEPATIVGLIQAKVEDLTDRVEWEKSEKEEESHKKDLVLCADKWPSVVKSLRKKVKR